MRGGGGAAGGAGGGGGEREKRVGGEGGKVKQNSCTGFTRACTQPPKVTFEFTCFIPRLAILLRDKHAMQTY